MGVTMRVLSLVVSMVVVVTGGCGGSPSTQISGGGRAGGGGPGVDPNGLCGGDVGRTLPASPRGFLPPTLGATVVSAAAPPAISGGTLRILSDGRTAIAADPDRDQIFIVDLASRALRGTVALQRGDEPGRVVEDAAGRVHVALRHGSAIATLAPASGALLDRRPVCAAPRGIAYDPAEDLLHVACAGGELVSLPAAGGPPVRALLLQPDLRDVVVDGPRLWVSRFRSAELLTLDADGKATERVTPPAFRASATRGGQLYSASGAWQTIASPFGGVLMLHQRGVLDQVQNSGGGYGGVDPCQAIVHPVVSVMGPGHYPRSGPALAGLVLAVDMALSPDGKRLAIVAAGNSANRLAGPPAKELPQVFVTSVEAATADTVGCISDGLSGPCIPAATGGTGCTADPAVPPVVGQPIAIAYAGDGSLVVQSREPAALSVLGATIALSNESRADTGHLVFHANAGGFLACASCHTEGNDDGRTWDFTCTGVRRTQSLQVGIRGTAPFHWSGDATDFTQLMTDVYVTRMSGPKLEADQIDALIGWIDNQPRPPRAAPRDPAAVERGRALFNDAGGANCASCHAGALFSSNQNEDVGTGGFFQVPSLVGVGTRGPFMHDGCAKTLRGCFAPDCGGDKHGSTSMLSAGQVDDLVSYLGSL